MKKLIFVLFAVATLAVSGCNMTPKSTALKQESENPMPIHRQYDLSVVRTQGNFSYIPINQRVQPSDMIPDILGLLDSFEKLHPDLEVVGWDIEEMQSTYGARIGIEGIWVTHRKKK